MEVKLAFRHLHNFSVYLVLKLLQSLKQPCYHCTYKHWKKKIRITLLLHSTNVPSYCSGFSLNFRL